MNKVVVMALVASACVGAAHSYAQDYLQYPSVRLPYEEGNSGVDFMEMYKTASIKTGITREHLPHVLDLKFGEDVKQRLDVYMPVDKPSGAPVFLFIHGGAFEEGDKTHYGYVAAPLAAHGIVTAVTSYRLVSRDPANNISYVDQENDIKAAIIWLYKNIARYGGDPNRIYIGGHSAGAILSANLGVDRKWLREAGVPESTIRGVAPTSGLYSDLSNDSSGPMADTPAAMRKRMSAILHIGDPAPHFVLSCGQKELELGGAFISMRDIEQFKSALEARHVHVDVAIQPAADHAGAVLGLSDEYSPETQALLRMIADSK